MRLSAEPLSDPSDQVSGWISNIQRFSLHDGPGIRSIVFFKGCQMRCAWCANPEGITPGRELFYHADRCLHCGKCAALCPTGLHRRMENIHTLERDRSCTGCGLCEAHCPTAAINVIGEHVSAGTVFKRVMADEIWFRQSGGGVTLSGGEVATQPNFARALIDRLKTEDIHITLETAGYASWHALHQASAGCNLIMYDLKSADDTLHKRFTGVSNKTIVRNLARLLQGDQQIIIRIPVIPGFNDAPDQAAKLLALIASLTHGRRNFLGVELLPYHRFGTGKYKLLSRDYGWNCHSANVDRFLHIAGHYHLTVNVSGTLAG